MSNLAFLTILVASAMLLTVNATGYRRRPPPRHRPSYQRPQAQGQTYTCTQPTNEYLFAVGVDERPYLYINDNGVLVGFVIDIIEAVCRVAGKTCHWASVPWSECSKTVSSAFAPGDYLMGGQVDVCAMWMITRDKLNSVDFSAPFYRMRPFYFTVRTGTNLDQTDFSGARVAIRSGFATNEFCIRTSGIVLTGTTFVTVNSAAEGVAALKSGTVDIFFFISDPTQGDPSLTSYVTTVDCGGTGGLMLKRGSSVQGWWNDAFDRYVTSGDYRIICAAAHGRHGGDPRCLGI